MMEYKLKIYDQFQCLGKDCPLDCCHQWRVLVDDETLNKWKQNEDLELRHMLLDNLEDHDKEGHPYKVISLAKDNNCIHLDANKLCRIQSAAGHDMLAATCQQFPRETKQTIEDRHLTLKMSCPRVVEMVFEDKSKEIYSAQGLGQTDPTREILAIWVNNVFNLKNIDLNIKITYLAEFLAKLAVATSQGSLSLEELKSQCAQYKKTIKSLQKRANKLPVFQEAAGPFWAKVLAEIRDPNVLGCNNEFPWLEDLKKEENPTRVLQMLAKSCLRIPLRPYHVHLEHYLQYSFFNAGFPLIPREGNQIASFMESIFTLATAALLLKINIETGFKITQKEVQTALYHAERWLRHTDRIYIELAQNQNLLHIEQYFPSFLNLV